MHMEIPSWDKQLRKIDELYDDLLAEILTRLPVKYILRCRSVQKSWYHLIRTPMFINLHLNHIKSTPHDHYSRYLFFHQSNNELTIRFDDIQCEVYCKIRYIPGLPYYAWCALSHGLICASAIPSRGLNCDRNIYLWNPLLKKYKILPDSPLPNVVGMQKEWEALDVFSVEETTQARWEALAFGFLPEVNDYVVVHIAKPFSTCESDSYKPNSVIIGIYSLNNNSWKKSVQDNIFIQRIVNRDVVFVNGVAFWVGVKTNGDKIILCFDTKTDRLCEILLPDWTVSCRRSPAKPIVHPFGRSIAYFVSNHELNCFDMWVLEGDPMNEFTWDKKMSVSVSKDVRSKVLGLRNNGDPILSRLFDMISYNLDHHEPNDFIDSWDRWDQSTTYFLSQERYVAPFVIRPFLESLVLLNN